MSGSDHVLVGLVEEAIEITDLKALERPLFRGWFRVSEVIDTMMRLELKRPLQHLIQQYDWRGEAITLATQYGLQRATGVVLKRPLSEFLPDVHIRSHMTQQLAGSWYWFPTLKCDAQWFDQLGHAQAEIARRNEFHSRIAFGIRDLLHESGGELREVPIDRVKAVIRACGQDAA
jgi:hypothetical protein